MDIRDESRKLRESGKRTTAAVTSAALLLGGVFHDGRRPDDEDMDVPPQTLIEMIAPDTDDGDDGDGSEEESDEKRRGERQRARWLSRGIRVFSGVGVWGIGCALVSLLSGLPGGISPLLHTVLVWLGMAAVLFCAFAATVKGVFPDLPLKKVFRKRSLWFLLFGALSLGVLEGVLMWRFPGSGGWREWLRLLGSMGVLSSVTVAALHREHRHRRSEKEKRYAEERAAKEAEALAQQTERDKRKVLALAESVSRRR